MNDRFAVPLPHVSRCSVTACEWTYDWTGQPITALYEALDDHMVEAHPDSLWAKRVIGRREREGLTD